MVISLHILTIVSKSQCYLLKAANKMLMLESVRKTKYTLEKIIQNLVKWSRYSETDMIERIRSNVSGT
jgi:hypothetical protein